MRAAQAPQVMPVAGAGRGLASAVECTLAPRATGLDRVIVLYIGLFGRTADGEYISRTCISGLSFKPLTMVYGQGCNIVCASMQCAAITHRKSLWLLSLSTA